MTVHGNEVHLTPIEYKLLQTLIRHAGKVITQRQLLIEVWGPQHSEQAQYLRVYMAQLRRKLEIGSCSSSSLSHRAWCRIPARAGVTVIFTQKKVIPK